jgi:rubrerythrin
MTKNKSKCIECGYIKKRKYSFSVCPKCGGTMYEKGLKAFHKEGSVIDLRKFIKKLRG